MYFQVQKWATISGDHSVDEKNILNEAKMINKTKMPNCEMLHALMTDVNPPICCLCLNTITEESPLQLEDEICLEECSEGIATVAEIIDCVLHRVEFVSTSICATCITCAVSAFKFIDMCEQASRKLNKVVDNITSELDENDKKNLRRTYRLFIATDVDSLQSTLYYDNKKHLTLSKKNENCKYRKAFFRFKTICSPEIFPRCANCGKTFIHKISLIRHIQNNNCIQLPCDSCGRVIARNYIVRHKQVCGLDYPTEVNKRIKKYTQKKILCTICGKSVTSIKKHLFTHDPEAKKECQQCGKKVSNNRRALKEHAKVCQKPRFPSEANYKCNICQAEYKMKSGLTFHMKIHSDNPDDYFECSWCKKRFSSKVQLTSHVVTHTQEKKFECTICGGKFVTSTSLTYHIRTHTGEKPYGCELCDLKFLSASRRRDHLRRHHLPPQLECLFCPKKFRGYGGLARHHRRHLNPNSGLYLGQTQIDILAQTNSKVSALIEKNISLIATYQKNYKKKSATDSEDSSSSYED